MKQMPQSIPEYPAAVQLLLQSYATETVITNACDRVNQAKQHPNEDEREVAKRLGRYAADAGSVFPELQLIAAYLSGLSAYVSATLRGRITPRITFPEVQAIAEEIGIAAKALAASRPTTRAPAPGLLPTFPSVGHFDFEAYLRVNVFQFTRGSALYRELFQFLDEIKAAT
jgi:hypothetical protein